MATPIVPWAQTANFPAGGNPWSGTPTKVAPAYTFFTPNQPPSAQELNYILNARDIALASVSASSALDTASNWGPVAFDSSGSARNVQGAAYDPCYGRWLAVCYTTTASIIESHDMKVWDTLSVGSLPNNTFTPSGMSVYPTTGTIMYFQSGAGPTTNLVRVTVPAASASGTRVATSQSWAQRGGATMNLAAMAYFYGANTPAMYIFGVSGYSAGSTSAFSGFAAVDAGSDGAGTWTDLHTSLPGTFASGTHLISKIEIAQSANTMVVALCGDLPGLNPLPGGNSFLMSVAANGTMADVTPSFIGSSLSIRGVAYSVADGLWGIVTTENSISPTHASLYVSPDLVNWTLVATISNTVGIALAVVRNAWAVLTSDVNRVTTALGGSVANSGRIVVLSGVLAAYQNNVPLTAPWHYAAYDDEMGFATSPSTVYAQSLFTSETPTAVIGSRSLLSTLVNLNQSGGSNIESKVLSLRSGYFDQTQAGSTSSAAVPGWNTALDVNFGSLPTTSFASDGSISLGGYTWTKSNSANDRTSLTNSNGSGLTWFPTGGDTSSTIYLPFTSFIPANALLWSTAIRVWVYIQSQNFSHNTDQASVYIETSGGTSWYEAIYGVNASNKAVLTLVAAANSTSPSETLSAAPGTSTNVMLMEVPALDSGVCRYLSGQYNTSVFPTEAGALYYAMTADGGTVAFQDPTAGGILLSGLGIALNVHANASSAALSVTIGRIRVDYKL